MNKTAYTALAIVCVSALMIACNGTGSREDGDMSGSVIIDTLPGVRIYTPQFSRIDLRCGTMPDTSERNVVFCAEAAFTHALLDTFSHSNIDGNHVSGGRWYEGATCIETPERVGNTGGFVWYDGHFEFLPDTAAAEVALRRAAEAGGMGFCQEYIIHEGRYQPNTRTENPRFNRVEMYRVLALIADTLRIVENTEPMHFSDFVPLLLKAGVMEALYMDMGAGWNHSWYRKADGTVHEIHPTDFKSQYCTNWITFYETSPNPSEGGG